MDRAYEANPASNAPPPPSPPQLGYPTEGGTPTVPGAWWFYMMTEELRAAIVAGGVVPDATQVNQLSAAISGMIGTAQQGYATEVWVDAQGFATEAFASDASNLASGTIPAARLPASFTVAGTIGSGVFNATSDRRLKKDIRPIRGALTRLAGLKGVTFTWRKDGRAGASIIAQDLRAVLPEGVSGDKTLFVDPMAVIGLLVQAVNELRVRLAKLEAR